MWTLGLHSNMNFPAPLSIVGFLGVIAGLVLMAIVVAVAFVAGKRKFAELLLKLGVAAAVAYTGLLLGLSLASREVVLARGEEKYFCEIDCHLAYSVVDVKAAPEDNGRQIHYLVSLRTRFDESTISSHRPKDAPLTPNRRVLRIEDAQAREYRVAETGGTPLSSSLVPGQSYLTELDFVVPSDATDLRLLVASAPQWEDHVLIGCENSWLHKKTWFRL